MSTKNIPGKRVKGVLYLDSGVGTGAFLGMDCDVSSVRSGSPYILPVTNNKNYYDE